MSNPPGIRIGTLGSAATFAGEATVRVCERYPEFAAPVYFKSIDDCWAQLKQGTVEAIVLSVERTGQANHGRPVVADGYYVTGYLVLPMKCNLYAKPGIRKEDIRRVTGHGSINQCITYLDRNFPGIPREIHGANSVEAAKAVIEGDGSDAVIGTPSLPLVIPGLAKLADGIDDGAIASWWIVSSKPQFSDRPTSLVITGQFASDGKLGELISAIGGAGYRLTTAAPFPTEIGIGTYQYILTFTGQGRLADVQKAVAGFPEARLSGAFENRS